MTNITMFHKGYCPYCKAARKLLMAQGLSFNEIEVGNDSAGFAAMVKRSNRRTVPQIFIGDTHIGGFDDLTSQLADNTFPFYKIKSA